MAMTIFLVLRLAFDTCSLTGWDGFAYDLAGCQSLDILLDLLETKLEGSINGG